jgi:hypothetical protein
VQVDSVRVTRDWDRNGLSNNREIENARAAVQYEPVAADSDGERLFHSSGVGERLEIYGKVKYPMETYPLICGINVDHHRDRTGYN